MSVCCLLWFLCFSMHCVQQPSFVTGVCGHGSSYWVLDRPGITHRLRGLLVLQPCGGEETREGGRSCCWTLRVSGGEGKVLVGKPLEKVGGLLACHTSLPAWNDPPEYLLLDTSK
ncbi:UNVERIFIED_CONTAM: hypothetical protein K2H54_005046 [Gekko kuhli]